MRHLVKGRKLNRTASHRIALKRNLAISLIEHKRIKTTLPKAKELQGFVERLVTYAKKNNLPPLRAMVLLMSNLPALTAASISALLV